MDETVDNVMKILFKALDNRIQPLIDKVKWLSNMVDGCTPLRHATTAKPPPITAIPPLPAQGEDNDSGRPSTDAPGGSAPSNLNPIASHEESGETRESADQPDKRTKVSRKNKAKANLANANAKVPGAAPLPAKPTS